LTANDIRFLSVDVSSPVGAGSSSPVVPCKPDNLSARRTSFSQETTTRWRQIVESENGQDHPEGPSVNLWRSVLYKSLVASSEGDHFQVELPQIWAVTEKGLDGTSHEPLRLPICKVCFNHASPPIGLLSTFKKLTIFFQNYTEWEELLLLKEDVADSLWAAFCNSFFQLHGSHRSVPDGDQPLNVLSNSSVSQPSLQPQTPTLTRTSSSALKIEPPKLKNQTLLFNSWYPDGESCHMQTMCLKDGDRSADVKVYWNKLQPPGPFELFNRVELTSDISLGTDFVDKIMMSPSYWNLPKPGLIVSITGSADPFIEEPELSPHDQPYVLFIINLPSESDEVLLFPVRKFSEASQCGAVSKCDQLCDVLFRMEDYMMQLNTFRTWVEVFGKAARENENFNWSALQINFECYPPDAESPCFMSSKILENMKPEALTRQNIIRTLEREFLNFMEKLTKLNCFCVRVKLSTVELSMVPAADKQISHQAMKVVLKIDDFNNFDIDTPIADNKCKDLFEFFVIQSDVLSDVQRRIENLSLGLVLSSHPHEFDGNKIGLIKSSEVKNKTKEAMKQYLALPRPMWQKSTIILQRNKDKKVKLFTEHDLQILFIKESNSPAEQQTELILMRSQGTGCTLSDKLIKNILRQVAFLMPLQYGSVWIITGGSDSGIMKVILHDVHS
jgi:hypothetical protein